MIWPESAGWPYILERDAAFRADVEALAAQGCAILLNSPRFDGDRVYNAAFLIAPGGDATYYDKRHLVPFGEYVPLQEALPFVGALARNAGSFAASDRISLLRLGPVTLGLAICFEITFPVEVAALVRDGATALATLTNDAWYGDTAAPWQHLRAARFRAAENHRTVLRAALTGISAWIEPDGSIAAALEVGVQGILRGELAPRVELTPFARAPWAVPIVCLVVTVAAFAFVIFDRRRRASSKVLSSLREDGANPPPAATYPFHPSGPWNPRSSIVSPTVSTTSGGFFEGAKVEDELASLDRTMQDPAFWSRPEENKAVLQRRRAAEKKVKVLRRLRKDTEELATWRELYDEDQAAVETEVRAFTDRLDSELASLELELKMAGEDDERSAIMALHPGAGGTESQDWAEMLLRMYLRWAERHGYEVELLDRLDGEEAGIKSATIALRGAYAYGYLRGENGVHRLVRISPYDAAKRRHTSFASVYVYPEIDDDVEIDIIDKDLRVDTYRSSGAGGQHVNVTDSAIRITHLPTNIVVTCQNERSQHKNRATAMRILRSRLYDLEMKKRADEQAAREGEKREIGFGSQIRSYVLHPYRMVKDHRTSTEVGDSDRVLDGDIDPFVEAFLRSQMEGAQAKAAAKVSDRDEP